MPDSEYISYRDNQAFHEQPITHNILPDDNLDVYITTATDSATTLVEKTTTTTVEKTVVIAEETATIGEGPSTNVQ